MELLPLTLVVVELMGLPGTVGVLVFHLPYEAHDAVTSHVALLRRPVVEPSSNQPVQRNAAQ